MLLVFVDEESIVNVLDYNIKSLATTCKYFRGAKYGTKILGIFEASASLTNITSRSLLFMMAIAYFICFISRTVFKFR